MISRPIAPKIMPPAMVSMDLPLELPEDDLFSLRDKKPFLADRRCTSDEHAFDGESVTHGLTFHVFDCLRVTGRFLSGGNSEIREQSALGLAHHGGDAALLAGIVGGTSGKGDCGKDSKDGGNSHSTLPINRCRYHEILGEWRGPFNKINHA